MNKETINPNSKKWFFVSAIIHSLVLTFLFFNLIKYEHYLKYPLQGLFLPEGDTSTYYTPLENAFQGEGYSSTCRMPALLPIYLPLRFIFNIFWTKNIIILIQILLAVIASVFIARIAYKLTQNNIVFYFVLLASSTSFLLNKLTYYGYMDSLGVSFLIFGYYILLNKKHTIQNLFLSGFFIGWSIFFRQVLGLNLVFLSLWLAFSFTAKNKIFYSIKKSIIFIFPFMALISAWNLYTYSKFNEIPILVKPGHKCWSGYPSQLQKVVKLVIGWGGNFTKWNGEAEWFITNNLEEKDFPFDNNIMTKAYNLDSLIQLRRDLLKSMSQDVPYNERQKLANNVSKKATIYLNSYKSENLFNYYFVNKFILLYKFTVPKQIDGLILPPLNKMNFIQIAAKIFWWGTFALFNLMGLFGFLLYFVENWKNLFLHVSFMAGFFYLTFYAGYIEQRYIAPYLPFLYLYAGYLLVKIIHGIKIQRKHK